MDEFILNILKNSTYETINDFPKRYFCVYWGIYKENNKMKTKLFAYHMKDINSIYNINIEEPLSKKQKLISIAPTLKIPEEFKDIIIKYNYG